MSTSLRGKGKTHKDLDKDLSEQCLSWVVRATQRMSCTLKRIDDIPRAEVVPIIDREPKVYHWLVGGEEGWGGPDAEADCIESGRNSAGSGVEFVPLDEDATGATKDLAWMGQSPSSGDTGEGEAVKPLFEVVIEHIGVNDLEYGE